jgi:hypothetical protein
VNIDRLPVAFVVNLSQNYHGLFEQQYCQIRTLDHIKFLPFGDHFYQIGAWLNSTWRLDRFL